MAPFLYLLLAVAASVCGFCVYVVRTVKVAAKRGKFTTYNPADVDGEAGHRLIRQGLTSKAASTLGKLDVIVVGSGVGGLTTAVCLARSGKKVVVLEQHDVAGGCTHSFQDGGFEFDTGLHYLGAGVLDKGKSSRKIFDALTDGNLEFAPMHDEYDVAVIGGKPFGFCSGTTRLRKKLKERFPDQSSAIDTYFTMVKKVNASARWYFVLKLLPRWLAGLLSPLLCGEFYKWSDKTVSQVLDPLFGKGAEVTSYLTYLFGDYGLPPARASFYIHATVANHYFPGACYPVGGTEYIARHATKVLESLGGRVFVRTRVETLLVEGGKCVGVRTAKGLELRAPAVVSAATAPVTFLRLLPEEHRPQEVVNALIGPKPVMQPAVGHLSLFLGLRGTAEELGIRASNFWCFPDGDHDKNATGFANSTDLTDRFMGAFISFPSTKDPTWAARYPGKSTCAVITEGGNYEAWRAWASGRVKHRGADYQELKDKLTRRLLDALYAQFPQLNGHVEFMELGTPLSNDFYIGSWKGSSYGLSHGPSRWRQDWLRPKTPIPGLYLSGQDILSAGVCGALTAGLFAAGAVSNKCLLEHVHLL